jgi:hypothetical protein
LLLGKAQDFSFTARKQVVEFIVRGTASGGFLTIQRSLPLVSEQHRATKLTKLWAKKTSFTRDLR